MSALKVLVLLPLWLLLTGFAYAASPSASPSPVATPSPAPSPSPSPTGPPPFIGLDVTAGGPNTTITVSGGSFPPGQAMSIYWDTPTKVIGSATSNGQGSFGGVKVKPFAGAKPGLHQICATVGTPNPCAQFELQGPPTPTPSSSASPSAEPSPSASPSESPSPSPSPIPIPAGNNTNGLDALLQPPFIFLPFIAALALLAAIAYWFFGARNRDEALPSAAVTHRGSHPGYGLSDLDIRPAPIGPTPGGAPPPPEPPSTEGTDETPPISES